VFDIVAGQGDVLAADLPEAEPSRADLDLIDLEELRALDVVQERIEAELTELAVYGAIDELAARRYRREVRAQLAQVTTAASAREVISA
jgi:hypothetical protein